MSKNPEIEQHFKTQSANDANSTQCANNVKKAKTIRKILQCERGEFGMSAIIGIAIGLIIAAFILIPGLQTFANTIISDMELWWTNSISSQIFPN